MSIIDLIKMSQNISEKQLLNKNIITEGRIEFIKDIFKSFDNVLRKTAIHIIPMDNIKLIIPVIGKVFISYDEEDNSRECHEFVSENYYHMILKFKDVIERFLKDRHVIKSFKVEYDSCRIIIFISYDGFYDSVNQDMQSMMIKLNQE
jgi:hypothetical protein